MRNAGVGEETGFCLSSLDRVLDFCETLELLDKELVLVCRLVLRARAVIVTRLHLGARGICVYTDRNVFGSTRQSRNDLILECKTEFRPSKLNGT